MKKGNFKDMAGVLLKYKYLIIVLIFGLILILLPTANTGTDSGQEQVQEQTQPQDFSLADQEARLENLLSQISGVGNVSVLLSLTGGVEREYAVSEEEILVVSSGSGTQNAVEVRTVYPEYLGAVIVCEGASSPQVRLEVTQAVSAFTGLGSDKITVTKMK